MKSTKEQLDNIKNAKTIWEAYAAYAATGYDDAKEAYVNWNKPKEVK